MNDNSQLIEDRPAEVRLSTPVDASACTVLAEAHRVPERGGQWGKQVFMTVLRSLCAYTHDMEPIRAKEECSGARVQAVAWGGPLMPHSIRAWGVEVICAGTQGRRGPAPLCGPCAHMSRAPLLSLRGCGPRSPSPPLPISTSMGSDGQMALGQ